MYCGKATVVAGAGDARPLLGTSTRHSSSSVADFPAGVLWDHGRATASGGTRRSAPASPAPATTV